MMRKESREISKGHKVKMLTEQLFTVSEASVLTRLAYWTVWDYLKTGRLMKTKVGGRTFIRRSELEKLIVDVPKPKQARRVR